MLPSDEQEYLMAQTQFTLEVAHALRHAIGGMHGYIYEARQLAELLKDISPHARRLQRALERADASAEHAQSCVASLRAIAMARMPEPSTVDLPAILRTVVDDVDRLARKQGIEIHYDFSPATVFADGDILRLILSESLRVCMLSSTASGKINVVTIVGYEAVAVRLIASPVSDAFFRSVARNVFAQFATTTLKAMAGKYQEAFDPLKSGSFQIELTLSAGRPLGSAPGTPL
jgi:ActR/RegA family two-component response regulator